VSRGGNVGFGEGHWGLGPGMGDPEVEMEGFHAPKGLVRDIVEKIDRDGNGNIDTSEIKQFFSLLLEIPEEEIPDDDEEVVAFAGLSVDEMIDELHSSISEEQFKNYYKSLFGVEAPSYEHETAPTAAEVPEEEPATQADDKKLQKTLETTRATMEGMPDGPAKEMLKEQIMKIQSRLLQEATAAADKETEEAEEAMGLANAAEAAVEEAKAAGDEAALTAAEEEAIKARTSLAKEEAEAIEAEANLASIELATQVEEAAAAEDKMMKRRERRMSVEMKKKEILLDMKAKSKAKL